MNDLETMLMNRTPTANRPLLGLTVLVVEDSLFACEAIRLMCLRSGARIRRADCLASARNHLRVYRPNVVIVDMGLPDGTGADLIRELADDSAGQEIIIGISGDEAGHSAAINAGAHGFILKPLESLAAFQQAILTHLPADAQPPGLRAVSNDKVKPDMLAFQDDVAHVIDVLQQNPNGNDLDYVAQFTTGVAKIAHDRSLEAAAKSLAKDRADGRKGLSGAKRLSGLLQDRLTARVVV